MNRRLFGAFGVLAAVAFIGGGCKNDPLSDLDGIPAALVVDFTHLQIGVGQTATVTASVLDARSTPLPIPVTFTACNNVVTAGPDTSYHPIPATSSRGVVKAQTPAPSCVVVQGAGFTDTVTVSAVPVVFTGAVSSTTPKGGDTLVIASTAQLKFDVAAVGVTFGGNHAAVIVSKSADTVRVLVPFSSPGALTIAGVSVISYAPPLAVTLPTSVSVTQTGDFWAPGDTGYASAPTLPLPTVTDQSTQFITLLPSVNNDANCGEGTAGGGLGSCTIFTYNANGTDSLEFNVNWTPPTVSSTDVSDIDIYSCGSAGVAACFEGGPAGAAGATAKTPEVFTIKPTAGVHYLVIEKYSSGEDANVTVTITKKN